MKRYSALLEKDWRLNRMIVVALIIAGTIPYLLAMAEFLVEWRSDTYGVSASMFPVTGSTLRHDWATYIYHASTAAGLFSAVVAAAFGGAAFAVERRERFAEFLAMLPIKRRTILFSKLNVAGLCLLTALAVHCGIRFYFEPNYGAFYDQAFAELADTSAMTLWLFGFAWLFSSFLESTAIATSVAIGVVLLTNILVADVLTPYHGAALALFAGEAGLIALAAGSVLYARRIAP